jgi:DNA-binding CsgD family transcriptional regulator
VRPDNRTEFPQPLGHAQPPDHQRGGSPFVGRDAELAQLVDLASGTDDRAGRLVTVVGEPGIGKTRLLREMAADSDATVLWGRASEYEGHLAFAVFREAFEDFLPTLGPADVHALAPGQVSVIRSVFPSLPRFDDAEPTAGPLSTERFHLYRAVRALLEQAARARRLLLVLDDIHWADEGSIELYQHLLRHPPRAGLVIAAAYRPRQVPARLAGAVGEAVRQGRIAAIELSPLPFDDVQTLLTADFDQARRARLYTLSEGNPLYLEALVRGANRHVSRANGRAGRDAPGDPWPDAADLAGPGAAVAAELAALASPPLLVARAAAIVGDLFEPDLVAEVAEVSLVEALAALDELVRRDLVRPAHHGGGFRFRHPLVRSAAYQSCGAGWRVAAHARTAAALRRRGAPAGVQAQHVERYATIGSTDEIRLLVAAADDAIHTAPAVAAHWLEAALRLMPDQADQVTILEGLARALGLSGRLRESLEVLQKLLGLLPPSTERRAYAACFCAMIERMLGQYDEANALLLAELDGLADQDSNTAAIIKVGLALGHMLRGDFAAERDWALEAAKTASQLGDRPLYGAALTVRGLGIMMGATVAGVPIGTKEEAFAGLVEACMIVDALPDQDVVADIDALAVLGSAEFLLERYGDAERHMRRVLALARNAGRVHLQANVMLSLGSLYGRTGRLAQAAVCFDDALDSALLTRSDELRSMAQAYRSWIVTWTGDVQEAARVAEEAATLAGSQPSYFSAAARARLAHVRFYLGDPDGCISMLISGCGGPELLALDPMTRLRSYLIMVAAEVAREGDATEWARLAEECAAQAPTRGNTGLARLAQATALAETQTDAAVSAADSAAEAFAAVGDPILLGYARMIAGRALATAHQVEPARARFAEARDLFSEHGAKLFLRQAVREERRMNALTPRRRRRDTAPAGAPPDGLTPRELEIAQMVASGLGNRQIAERLYVSTRTVESHLARVFTKLGVTSRSAVVHALERSRLDRDQ